MYHDSFLSRIRVDKQVLLRRENYLQFVAPPFKNRQKLNFVFSVSWSHDSCAVTTRPVGSIMASLYP